MAGLSSPSPTLTMAGERGWIPMSLNLNPAYCASHWDSYEAGARKGGHTVSRKDWRMVREIFVADTDEEAWEHSVNGMMGRMMKEYFLPLLDAFGFTDYLKADQSHTNAMVTPEYCAEHNWLIGSPQTVAEKIRDGVKRRGSSALYQPITNLLVADRSEWNEVLLRMRDASGQTLLPGQFLLSGLISWVYQ